MLNVIEMARNVVPTGDYAADCALGRQLARDVLEVTTADDDAHDAFPPRFARIVAEVVERGTWGPVEIGFFTAMGGHARH